MSRLSKVAVFGAVAVIAITVVGISLAAAFQENRSLEDFKKYVNEKTGGEISESLLEQIANQTDADGDGMISQDEFANRGNVIRRLVLSQDEAAGKNNPPQSRGRTPGDIQKVAPLTNSDEATVLLITHDSLATAWQPFAKWKTQFGKLTKIITTGEIASSYSSYSGDSIQEQIRLCIRDHIDHHGTRWVILGGDSLPGGKGLVPGGHSTFHRQEPRGIPTDIVYLSSKNWDADGDGYYGEFGDDEDAIEYPDGSVGLGRIPVRTAADVKAFTDKVVAYESNYPTNGFAKHLVYTCTDSHAYPKVLNSWDGYVSKKWDGQVDRFFTDKTPWDEKGKPGSYDLSADNIVDLINQNKTGKFHIHGHGYLEAWVLEKSMFTANHVGQLTNQGAYPLITTVSCNTGEYDSKQDPSIVESILRQPNAGSVAVVAPVRTGKPHFKSPSDFRLMITEGKLDGTTMTMTKYWSHGLSESLTTGHALMAAKADIRDDAFDSPAYHLCMCELNLLGDPTLDMRSDNPITPTISTQISNENQLTVTCRQPGATICVWGKSGDYQIAVADNNGVAKFNVANRSNAKNQLLVSVSGPNLNSTSKTVVY